MYAVTGGIYYNLCFFITITILRILYNNFYNLNTGTGVSIYLLSSPGW